MEEKTHDLRRPYKNGKGSYEKIIEGIDRLLEYDIPFHISLNIDKSNMEEAAIEVLRLADKYSSATFFFSQVANGVGHHRHNALSMKEYDDFLDAFFKKHPAMMKRMPAYNSSRVLSDLCCAAKRVSDFIIDPYGDIYKCISFVGLQEAKIGSLMDSWDVFSSHFSREADALLKNDCVKCRYFALCWGGCRLIKQCDPSHKGCCIENIRYQIFLFVKRFIHEGL